MKLFLSTLVLLAFTSQAQAKIQWNTAGDKVSKPTNYTFQNGSLYIQTGLASGKGSSMVISKEDAQASLGLSLSDIQSLLEKYKNDPNCTLYVNGSYKSGFNLDPGPLVIFCK